jgi:hypothetical protein
MAVVTARFTGIGILWFPTTISVIRRMELAAQESDQVAQEARAQFLRVEALLSRLEEWRRPLTK